MSKISYLKDKKYRKDVDFYEINDLAEMGLDEEEIAKEIGVSKKYVKKIIDKYYDNY